MLKTWRNGEDAAVVQKIIESNFKILGRHLPNNMLCLSKSERLSLSDDYLCGGLIVYDTTDNIWYQYSGGQWIVYNITPKTYSRLINDYQWTNGEIRIPSSTHLVSNPLVQLFMLNIDGNYEEVFGGVFIDSKDNITLTSDIPFTGKVVIK